MTRNEKIKTEIENQLQNLSKYVDLKFVKSIDLDKLPSCLIAIGQETINYDTDIEAPRNLIATGSIDVNITFVFKATTKSDTDEDLDKQANDFIEFTTIELEKMTFPFTYTHSYNGTDYYRIVFEQISSITSQRFDTYRDQLKSIVTMQLTIDFEKIKKYS